MKKFLSQHPYATTSVIFIILMAFGFFVLAWRKDDFTLMLLLYFIVTLGIRLDEISRQIGNAPERSASLADQQAEIVILMQQLHSGLEETNRKLEQIRFTLQQTRND